MIDFETKRTKVGDGKSSLAIVQNLGDIPGGVALDFSVLPAAVTVLRPGHLIVTKDEKYYPATVTGSAYDALTDKKPVGVLVSSVSRTAPLGSVLTIGQVREKAAPYPFKEEVKKALPLIQFI